MTEPGVPRSVPGGWMRRLRTGLLHHPLLLPGTRTLMNGPSGGCP
ncbi:hypothetical protein ACFCXS_09315 [Streptomyces sp. NPDC056373]